jgi:hypothetical protein
MSTPAEGVPAAAAEVPAAAAGVAGLVTWGCAA